MGVWDADNGVRKKSASGTAWKGRPEMVTAQYAKADFLQAYPE